MNKAVIVIPENISIMEVSTNDVHPIILVQALTVLQKHFATQLYDMAKKEVGDNPILQAQWLDRLNKKYLGNNDDDLKMEDINRFN